MSAVLDPIEALTIRRLDPVEDNHLYDISYQWLASSPSWRKQTEAVFGTLDHEDYMDAIHDPGRCDIGIFVEDRLVAIVILTLVAKGTYEVHFEAAHNTDPEVVIAAGHMIRQQLFGAYKATTAFTWTPIWNRSVLAINRAIGFSDDHVSMFRGTCRGRLIEWVRLSMRG